MSRTLAEEGLTIPDAPAEPGEFERSLRATRESGRKLLVAYVTGGLHDEWPDVSETPGFFLRTVIERVSRTLAGSPRVCSFIRSERNLESH